jgi:UDP-N-acetyl-D-mannosaminuronic acid dehydrogenase
MTGSLLASIASRTARVVVIGLGYVGLPVAALAAEAGYAVIGLDLKAERVAQVNAGGCPISGEEPGLAALLAAVTGDGRLKATTDYAVCREARVILIAVETPVDDRTHLPSYEALRSALTSLAVHAPSEALVIIESTLAPGSMDRIVAPALLPVASRLLLAHCPERLTPGKLLRNVREMPRVVGGMTPQAAHAASRFYAHFVEGDLDMTDALTAETVKTAENAYRDVQIAFANELALVCEDLGTDVWQVRDLVNRVPGRQVHLPGAGVGGHCIPKDPWLLLAHTSDVLQPRLIPAARAVNDGMPLHVVSMVSEALSYNGLALRGARVAVIGYAYREDSDDTRNTPSATVVQRLREMGADVAIHDPHVPGYDGALEPVLAASDCAVLMVAHRPYLSAPWHNLVRTMRHPLLIDTRRILTGAPAGAMVWRLGDGRQPDTGPATGVGAP